LLAALINPTFRTRGQNDKRRQTILSGLLRRFAPRNDGEKNAMTVLFSLIVIANEVKQSRGQQAFLLDCRVAGAPRN